MRISKIERQLNLVICLLSARSYLSAEQIKSKVLGYEKNSSSEAFLRMFERDKADLRSVGIPLKVVKDVNGEDGYQISREEYEIPEIVFSEKEALVILLAVRYLQNMGNSLPINLIKQKLLAAGLINSEYQENENILEVVNFTNLPDQLVVKHIITISKAIENSQVISFNYYSAHSNLTKHRLVSPQLLFSEEGNWYLKGYDHSKKALLTYKIDRFTTEITFEKEISYVKDIREVTPSLFASEQLTNAKIIMKNNKQNELIFGVHAKSIQKLPDHQIEFIFEDVSEDWLLSNLLAMDAYKIIGNPNLENKLRKRVENFLANSQAIKSITY